MGKNEIQRKCTKILTMVRLCGFYFLLYIYLWSQIFNYERELPYHKNRGHKSKKKINKLLLYQIRSPCFFVLLIIIKIAKTD